MSWFQPTATPPTAAAYRQYQQPQQQRQEQEEYEFGENPNSRRQTTRTERRNQNQNQSKSQSESLMQDPLSRRMMSLLSPMIPSSIGASAVMETHSQSLNLNHPLPFVCNNSNATRDNISPFPHPSFPHRNENESRNGNGNADDEVNFDFDSTFGYVEHAHFFHPRKITADKPFVSSEAREIQISQSRNISGRNDNDQNHNQNHNHDPWNQQHEYQNQHDRHQSHEFLGQNQDQQYDIPNQGLSRNGNLSMSTSSHGNERHFREQDQHTQARGAGENYNYNQSQIPNTNNHPDQYQYQQQQHNQHEYQSQGHRFGYTYHEDEPSTSNNRNKRKRNQKQRRIIQNQPNGELGTVSHTEQEQGWAQVGQIAAYQTSEQAPSRSFTEVESNSGRGSGNKSNKRKKKKKKSKKGSDGAEFDRNTASLRGSSSRSQHEEMEGVNGGNEASGMELQRQTQTQAQHNMESDDNFEKQTSRTRSKKNKRTFPKDPSTNMNLNTTTGHEHTNGNSNFNPSYDPIPLSTMEIFAETYDVKNAGGSDEALRSFLQLVKDQKHVSWTMIFHDDICSNPFAPSTKKYCTPKGRPCQRWNCTCDNQIRAMQAAAPLVGVMFVFPMSTSSDGESTSAPDCFLLPLGPNSDPEEGPKDIDAGFERMARWPFLPISCDTSLRHRWETFRKILLDRSVVKVTYNAQMGLMPFHYHCANDLVNDENSNTEQTNSLQGSHAYLDLALPKIWDLRLASWMLSPHSKEEVLEMEDKRQGFAHLYTKSKCEPPPDSSGQLLGLIKAKEDLEFLYALYPVVDRLLENNGLKDSFYEIESPLQSVLSSMECFGIGFKAERLLKIQSSMVSKIETLVTEARSIARDDELMLSSPQQVSFLLFEKMGLSPPVQTYAAQNKQNATNHKSTSEESLKAMQNTLKSRDGNPYRIIEIVLQFRALNKVLNTYIRPYPKLARDAIGLIHSRRSKKRSKKKSKSNQGQKIHPMWMQTAVRTGRLSCRKPNLQQVPTGSVMGVCPRNAFTSSTKQSCLFACDYSQNEVRILAHMSSDEALIRLFTQPDTTDIYKQMSSVINGKHADDVSDQERAVAKQVTLAIMYGMGINSVAKKLGITRNAAQQFFQSFYGRFRGVKSWMDKTVASARTNKFVTTITGRKRYVQLFIAFNSSQT